MYHPNGMHTVRLFLGVKGDLSLSTHSDDYIVLSVVMKISH